MAAVVSPRDMRAARRNMTSAKFLDDAKNLVADNFNAHRNPERSPELLADDMNFVWFGRILAGWKATIMSPQAHGMIWEVTYSVSKNEWYLDIYKKLNNIKISMGADSE